MSKFNLILDSGAFSAWTKKTEISVEEYTDFCLKHLDHIEYIVNLDVIPGEPGHYDISERELDRAASQGWAHYQYMCEHLPKEKIIPVFHQGEKFRWLKQMVEATEYLGLSPANDRSTYEKIMWLDECMQYVCDSEGMPKVKFHAFGVTSVRILRRYPWYSADSASWVMFSRYGTILLPHMSPKGEYIYGNAPITIQVTQRATSKERSTWEHYDNMPFEAKQNVRKYVHEMGFKWGNSVMVNGKEKMIRSGVSSDHRQRDLLNLCFFIGVQKSLTEWPWQFEFVGW